MLEILPLTKHEAYALAERWVPYAVKFHRPVFGLACGRRDGGASEIVGVAVAGMPRAAMVDDGWTLEAHIFVCPAQAATGKGIISTALEESAWRAARALGYRRMVDPYRTLATTADYDQSRDRHRAQASGKGRKGNWESAMGGRNNG